MSPVIVVFYVVAESTDVTVCHFKRGITRIKKCIIRIRIRCYTRGSVSFNPVIRFTLPIAIRPTQIKQSDYYNLPTMWMYVCVCVNVCVCASTRTCMCACV